MRTFDRIPKFDERSRDYPIRILITPTVPRSYTWRCPIVLDQGSEGACTGFAVAQEAAARPVMVAGITNAVAKQIYYRARQLDEWEGENYEGSSVLGAMKAGQEKGWYQEYRWVFGGEPELALAVSFKGPAVLGINWYEGMSNPDRNGLIRPTGALQGGHAILCIGYNTRTGLYRLHNSWGAEWGINGGCFISKQDMALLLKQQGEACVPVIRNMPKMR